MSATPESMLFTWEFDPAAASQQVARAPTAAVSPSLTAQLAAARAGAGAEAPILPAALPDQVNLLIRGPNGTIEVAVGREKQDVSVRVEVPTGLMAAVREAQAPIQLALELEGYDLESFDIHAGEPGVEQAPEHDRSDQRGGHSRQTKDSNDNPDSEHTQPTGPRSRLLDLRA